MYCSSCQQKLIKIDCTKNNIWGFNPYIFQTYKTMKFEFSYFYKNIDNIDKFYSIYNEEGYTYTQWYVYVISKNNYKYKELKKQTLWLFQILSGYDFFKKLIVLGKIDDPLYTTLHHFLKYLDNMGIYQECILKLLIDNDLYMDKEDGEGITGNDYLFKKILSEEDLKITKEITRQYKLEEEILYSHYLFNEVCFNRCDLCKKFVNIYQDIIINKSKILNFKELTEKFNSIINKRQECIDIYQKYENFKNSTDRHTYVVNIYKSII
jgi:hypothetical protein